MARATIWKFWSFVVTQTLDQLAIFIVGIPAYRRLLIGQAFYDGKIPIDTALWIGTAVILMQAAYWSNYRSGFEQWPQNHFVLGHVILFASRLNFIFIAGLFSASLFLRFDTITFSFFHVSLLVGVVFAGFCYTLELERIGRSLVL